jgi:aspartyl-tRNA(Asn)/glutamyl-tRNA(Gln) amidotransferase subunit A
MTSDLCDLPGHELTARLRKKEISAVEIVEAFQERIADVEGRAPSTEPYQALPQDLEKVHAYISLTVDRARRQAEAIDQALSAGEPVGPLAGVPLAIKDIFCVRGTSSTAASRILENFVAPYSATPVERLETAGALTLGKVNLDEFTFGSSNESSAFLPPPGNPWDPSRVPGGSSGGSAAAVAAGEAAISLGTDTSGSIRQPAAFCGVVGVKPTYGRVSRYGLIAFASSLDCPGPVARDVTDAALALMVMAGPDPRDATAADLPVPEALAQLDQAVPRQRIGLSPDYFRLQYPDSDTGELAERSVDPQIEAAVRSAADLLSDAGHEIVEGVPMPNTRHGVPAYFVISRVEAASNLHRYDGVKYGYRYPGSVADLRQMYRHTRGNGFGLQPKLRILMGMYVSGEEYEKGYYQRALRVRTLIRQDFERAFDPEGDYRLDCLLAPTTPSTAFEIGAVYGDTVTMQYADLLTVPANHAGVPAVSIPAGFDGRGLPIGIQMIGPDFSEVRLLQAARVYERATEGETWRWRRPRVVEAAGGGGRG